MNLMHNGLKQRTASLRQDIINISRTGLIFVILANVLAKICATLGSIFIVRVLTESDYGFYARVINDYSMIYILEDFGCRVAMMQFRGENFKDKRLRDAYFVEPFRMALLFGLAVGTIILVSPLFYPYGSTEEAVTTQMLALVPVLTIANYFLIYNLVTLSENRKYAGLYFCQTFLQYSFLVAGAFFYGKTGAVLSGYAYNIVLLAIAVIVSKKELHFDWRSKVLDKAQKLAFLKFAVGAQLNNTINDLLSIFDIFMLGRIITDDTVIAGYKVAATIPISLRYVSTSIMTYASPYFARNIDNISWVRKNAAKMIAGCTLFCGAITAAAIALARPIIILVFGEVYSGSVKCFIILMIAYFFAGSFQIPAANVIFTQHKVKVNIIITVIANIANCLLNYYLIKRSGAVGAAVATCSVSILASVLAMVSMIMVIRTREAETSKVMDRVDNET